MDVKDFWPDKLPPNTSGAWDTLVKRRVDTAKGFTQLEKQNGFITMEHDINTARGQEVVRLYCFRALEELSEALESEEQTHYREELIDAVNYLWSLLLMRYEPRTISDYLFGRYQDFPGTGIRLTFDDLGHATYHLGYSLGDMLRNRAWMNRSQSPYFDGDLMSIVCDVLDLILPQFETWQTFYSYFVAKDEVLQFRLRSKY